MKYPKVIQNLRGKGTGTFIAFDTPDSSSFVKEMRKLGVNVGSCGVSTIRLRPMLIFDFSHIPILVDALDAVCNKIIGNML